MNNPQMQISQRVQEIPEALSIYINQLVYDEKRRGRDITTLSLGEAFFQIPLFDFTKLDYIKGYHYSESQGLPELRKKIAQYYTNVYQAPVDAQNEVLISAGSKILIYLALQATINPGDEVLIHEPAWLSYQEQVRLAGGVVRFIPYHVEPKDFHHYFSDKTKMLILNNPNNPAGWLYPEKALRDLYAQTRSCGIYILMDEAYSDFVVDDGFCSMARVAPDKQGVIVVNSLSKNMGMSGWRIGYVIAEPCLIRHLLKLNQHTITCGPTLLLHYLARYFDDILSVTLPQVREVVEKRKRVEKMIQQMGLNVLGGSATFYFFVGLGDFSGSGHEFSLDLLLNHGIAVVPGSAYGESTAQFVRVSIGTESEERIEEALKIIKDQTLRKDFQTGITSELLQKRGYPLFQNTVSL